MFRCSVSTQKNKEGKKEKTETLYLIDIEAIINNPQRILISEIATAISYIPLETRQDNMLNKIRQVRLTESFIFVSDNKRLLQFTRTGKFVRQIGKTGRGPGEYSSVINFSVNEQANIILVVGGYQFYKYNFKGDYLDDVTKTNGVDFICYNPTRIAFYHNSNVEKPFNLTITTQNLNTVCKFQNNNPRPKTKFRFGPPPMYVFNNQFYFKEHFNDTVFCVKDSLFIPHIVYNEKNLLFDKNFDLQPGNNVADLLNQLRKVKDKLMTKNIFESKKFVFTSYLKGEGPLANGYTRVLFDKGKNKAQLVDDSGFINDLDGGNSFWPNGIFQDDIMVNYQDAYQLKAHVASEAFKNSTPKYPEKKKALEKLVNSLNENDNPVLMLVKLKE